MGGGKEEESNEVLQREGFPLLYAWWGGEEWFLFLQIETPFVKTIHLRNEKDLLDLPSNS